VRAPHHQPHDPDGSPDGQGLSVLVTGGAGFIGSHLVDQLLCQGHAVTVIDDLSTGRRCNLPDRHERLRFIEADLAHALAAFGAGERFDRVYHLAAAVGVKRVMDDPVGTIHTNVHQTGDLLTFALDHGPNGEPAPTLIASTSEVYGKGSRSPFSEEDDVVYGPTTVTRWSYACSKAIDEFLALAHHRRDGLPVVVVRFFNTVGPRQVGQYGMVLPRFIHAASRGEDLVIHGDGSQSRCFADVRDVVPALPALLDDPRSHGRVFNIGRDEPITIGELALVVIRTLGSASGVRRIPYGEVYPEGFEDLRERRPDLTRIRQSIGYAPKIDLESTIRDMANAATGAPGC